MVGRKETFNDALSTFYLQLYGVRHDREEAHCQHLMGYSFQLAARDLCIYHPKDRIVYITAFVTPAVEHWIEHKIAQWTIRQMHTPLGCFVLPLNH